MGSSLNPFPGAPRVILLEVHINPVTMSRIEEKERRQTVNTTCRLQQRTEPLYDLSQKQSLPDDPIPLHDPTCKVAHKSTSDQSSERNIGQAKPCSPESATRANTSQEIEDISSQTTQNAGSIEPSRRVPRQTSTRVDESAVTSNEQCNPLEKKNEQTRRQSILKWLSMPFKPTRSSRTKGAPVIETQKGFVDFCKMGKSHWKDIARPISENLQTKWDREIENQLFQHLLRLLVPIQGKQLEFFLGMEFSQIGSNDDVALRTEPTIVVTCGSHRGLKAMKKAHKDDQFDYLDNFAPILFLFTTTPPWKPAADVACKIKETSMFQPKTLKNVLIEDDVDGPRCGLKIKFCKEDGTFIYAVFGGRLSIGGRDFGLIAAHPVLSGLRLSTESPVTIASDSLESNEYLEDTDSSEDTTSDEDQYDDVQSALSYISSDQSSDVDVHEDKTSYRELWQQKPDPRTRMCFIRNNELEGSYGDWALFRLPKQWYAANVYSRDESTIVEVSEVVKQSVSEALQEVSILCGTGLPWPGYLTQNTISFQHGALTLKGKEVITSRKMSRGVSGSWIVRHNLVYGFVVALAPSGRSCLMLSMAKVFESISQKLNKEVLISKYGIKTSTDLTHPGENQISRSVDDLNINSRDKKSASSFEYNERSRQFSHSLLMKALDLTIPTKISILRRPILGLRVVQEQETFQRKSRDPSIRRTPFQSWKSLFGVSVLSHLYLNIYPDPPPVGGVGSTVWYCCKCLDGPQQLGMTVICMDCTHYRCQTCGIKLLVKKRSDL